MKCSLVSTMLLRKLKVKMVTIISLHEVKIQYIALIWYMHHGSACFLILQDGYLNLFSSVFETRKRVNTF
jgi:hypothetical protein